MIAALHRSAEHAANGCDVDEYLDTIAATALVRLYPAEVPDFADLYERKRMRRGYAEHVIDALVLAVSEAE